jgi:hypothetical protein
MRSLPLRLGPLGSDGCTVQRSAVRWLVEDGQACRSGQVVAFCNIGVASRGKQRRNSKPFAEESADFQVAFAAPAGGVVRRAAEVSSGGYLGLMYAFQSWQPDSVIGHVDVPDHADAEGELRLLLLTGRRASGIAEDRSGLLTGWHDRSRAWWGEGDDEFGTLLSLGICEQLGVIRGEKFAFLDLFDAVPGPAHVVYTPDEALVPCSAIVTEQLRRTQTQAAAIATDMAEALMAGAVPPTPGDWMFAGCLQAALARSPLTDEYDMLTRARLTRAGPADAVVLSLAAEPTILLRHRRLGYLIFCHDFRIQAAGPAIHEWLRTAFEPVRRSHDDILRDYREMIDSVRSRGDTAFLILNAMSTSGHEDIFTYAPFDPPLGGMLSSIRAKEMNLLLHDLARERDVSIVDVDAIAAEIGAAAHLPDGMHQSGLMQAETRAEMLRLLRDRGVRGFQGAAVR